VEEATPSPFAGSNGPWTVTGRPVPGGGYSCPCGTRKVSGQGMRLGAYAAGHTHGLTRSATFLGQVPGPGRRLPLPLRQANQQVAVTNVYRHWCLCTYLRGVCDYSVSDLSDRHRVHYSVYTPPASLIVWHETPRYARQGVSQPGYAVAAPCGPSLPSSPAERLGEHNASRPPANPPIDPRPKAQNPTRCRGSKALCDEQFTAT
jgi:hypothetical protein